MKKKIFGGIAVAAIAFAIAFNLSVKQDSNKLSALALDNVEALAEENIEDNADLTIKEWWNRLDYDCVWRSCNQFYEGSYPIKVEKGKGTVAHTWECLSC